MPSFLPLLQWVASWRIRLRPAEFLYENLVIETNVIHAAREAGVKKLLFLGSSCIYPRLADQPMREEALLTGALEPTNEWYAIAKIAGIKLCQAFRRQYGCDFVSVMPTNLYGPGDRYDARGWPRCRRADHEDSCCQDGEQRDGGIVGQRNAKARVSLL